MEKCNHRLDGTGDPGEMCGDPAVKFYVVTFKNGLSAGQTHLHPRCEFHWEKSALPTSPHSTEVTEEEFAVWKVMLA